MPAPRRTAKRTVCVLNPSDPAVLDDSTVDGASTVAGVETTFVVACAGSLFAGAVAGFCCVIAFEVALSVVVVGAACVVVSGSFGNGARVSDGNAFAADGLSTLGEFVANGPGVFSFVARVIGGDCVIVSVFGKMSGAFGFLLKVRAGAGIGLGSIDGGAGSFLATSFDGLTVAATFCEGWSQPTS